MTSWKRLFGKKNRKAHLKAEQKYDQWMRLMHDQYGSHPEIPQVPREIEKEKKRPG